LIETGSEIATESKSTLSGPERTQICIAKLDLPAAGEHKLGCHILILRHLGGAEGMNLDPGADSQRLHDPSNGIRRAHVKIVLGAVIRSHDQVRPGGGIPGGVRTRLGLDRYELARQLRKRGVQPLPHDARPIARSFLCVEPGRGQQDRTGDHKQESTLPRNRFRWLCFHLHNHTFPLWPILTYTL
jgi:hypothetical protein